MCTHKCTLLLFTLDVCARFHLLVVLCSWLSLYLFFLCFSNALISLSVRGRWTILRKEVPLPFPSPFWPSLTNLSSAASLPCPLPWLAPPGCWPAWGRNWGRAAGPGEWEETCHCPVFAQRKIPSDQTSVEWDSYSNGKKLNLFKRLHGIMRN